MGNRLEQTKAMEAVERQTVSVVMTLQHRSLRVKAK